MNLGEFEEANENIKELDKLLPMDNSVKALRVDLENLKEKTNKSKKTFLKKGLFGNGNLYEDKEVKVKSSTILPEPNMQNKFIYLDLIVDNNHKNPYKVKFELFAENGLNVVTDYIFNQFKTQTLNFKNTEASFIENGNVSFMNLFKIPFENVTENESGILADTIAIQNRNYPLIETGLLCIQYKEYLVVNLSNEILNEPNSCLVSRVVIGRCSYNKKFFEYIKELYSGYTSDKENKQMPTVKLISFGISVNL